MRVESPICKRCCCCVPLRYGLIVWGYIKTLLACWEIYNTSNILIMMTDLHDTDDITVSIIVFLSFVAVVCSTDIISGIIFIVACHLKNRKIIKIYYFYAIFIIAWMSMISLFLIITFVYPTFGYSNYNWASFAHDLRCTSVLFLNIVAQIYLVTLIKSEIKKLENGYQLRFVNNAAEAECTMDIEQIKDKEYVDEMKQELTHK